MIWRTIVCGLLPTDTYGRIKTLDSFNIDCNISWTPNVVSTKKKKSDSSSTQHGLAHTSHDGRMTRHAIITFRTFIKHGAMILITIILRPALISPMLTCFFSHFSLHFFSSLPPIFYPRLSFGNTLSTENLFTKQNNQSPVHFRHRNANMLIQLRMAILS